MTSVHEAVRCKIALQTDNYAHHANLKHRDKQFEGCYIHARQAGPFQILKKLGHNAYVIDLPYTYTISHVFNVEDLTEFKGEIFPPRFLT
ncbi:hypothetical protein JRO89_XS13G0180000 [Xanthoceras sorbifolium]|uniref:Tf2-1-like SH3-like domain-containing protein n=1 Tax=Xanthoceras sorbifolium TaxID=99658 RepID=A0ABQ8H8X6_9ROSI|nr:hypothetical protein JRO89_XS13G0180000 [Xanthoceras sorbifolium]